VAITRATSVRDGVWRSKKNKADTATTEARTILTPFTTVKQTPPKHSAFLACANECARERKSLKLKLLTALIA